MSFLYYFVLVMEVLFAYVLLCCFVMLFHLGRYDRVTSPGGAWEKAISSGNHAACEKHYRTAQNVQAAADFRLRAFSPIYLWRLIRKSDWSKEGL